MDIRKLTRILLGLGIIITIGLIIWWAYFYNQVIKETGGTLGDFFQCLFLSSGPCSVVGFLAGLAGITTYNPTLFWIGGITIGAGIVIKFSLKKRRFFLMINGFIYKLIWL